MRPPSAPARAFSLLPLLPLLLLLLLLAPSAALHLPCGRDAPSQPRLVVNSHHAYGRALEHFLASLWSVGFRDFCRVLVVVGGSERDAAPLRVGNISYIYTTQNAHDLTSLHQLSLHKDNPAVRAPGYFYLHDTCLFHPGFPIFWERLHTLFDDDPMLVWSMKPPGTANIAAFGHGVVENLGGAFAGDISKQAGMGVEENGGGVVNSTRFGSNVTWVRRRVEAVPLTDAWSRGRGQFVDTYNTGYPRSWQFYEDFFIFKAVFLAKQGDFQGRVVDHKVEILPPPWPPGQGGGKGTGAPGEGGGGR